VKKSNDVEDGGRLRRQSIYMLNRIKELQTAAAKSNDEICQTLGKVLGFPWYKDDLSLFPGATESDGVCVGDHVGETLAVQAADRIRHLDSRLQIDTLNPNRREHIVILAGRIDDLEAQNLEMQSRIDELCPPPSDEFQAVLDSIPQIK
jgi:hypothetical protein